MLMETEVCESPELIPLYFCLWGWLKSEVYERKADTRDELLAGIFDAAVGIKRRQDQLRRTTRYLRTRVAKCTEVDGGTFIVNCNKSVTSV
jgi:hypothetical protein